MFIVMFGQIDSSYIMYTVDMCFNVNKSRAVTLSLLTVCDSRLAALIQLLFIHSIISFTL